MQRRPLAFAVAFALVAGTVIVPGVGAAGRPTCLVSNERTHLGSTTLQASIDAARAGDTLIVKGTCVGSPPSLPDRGASNIRKSLTIRGVSNKAFGPATLDGGGVARVLFVDFFDPERRGFSLTIENLTITNGFGEDGSGGGGLLAQGGTVVIKNSIVTANSSGVVGGGGIEAFADSMTITNSTVSYNVAGGDGGGGIYGGGTLIIEDSAITGNVNTRGFAGGLFFGNGSLTIRNSTVSGNRACAGGGIFLSFGTATLTNSTVVHNTADGSGGGIVVNSGGSMAIVTSTVSQNVSGSSGGGIENGGDMTLDGSIVSGNTSVYTGGGILNLGTLAFAAPPTTVGGNTPGGIYNHLWYDATVTGGCPVSLGGYVLYSPTNTPTDYSGFTCS